MFSPPLYGVIKLPLTYVINSGYNVLLTDDDITAFKVMQGDNMMFRQIRLISGDCGKMQKYVVFVDATGGQNKPDAMQHLIEHGFSLNNRAFLFSERSASMVRQSMLSFVDAEIEPELSKRISMELDFSESPTVLAKYYAYRGLCLSSCFCLEDWYPKIIVCPDFYRTIPNQIVKYAYDKQTKFIDRKTGKERDWVQKDIGVKETDIEINAFDGCGICHPAIMREFELRIGTSEKMNSLILRGPYIKGCVHELDYVQFYAERGVTKVKDIWGIEYDVTPDSEPMIIILESQYKGLKYFKRTGTIDDWDRYWELFRKYNHCLGVAKWNFTLEQEALMTRVNYQILQTLDYGEDGYNKFKHLADDSVHWYEKIVNGDMVYTYAFLGLTKDNVDPMNWYMAALLRNPEMIHDTCTKDYVHNLLEKYRNEMKCGKLWMDATFKFLAPDLIALMEHIGGLPVVGCLKENEFYCFDRRGIMEGERLITRNPHINAGEDLLLVGAKNELTEKYLSGLQNVLCLNSLSISAPRLNGADQRGLRLW